MHRYIVCRRIKRNIKKKKTEQFVRKTEREREASCEFTVIFKLL